MANGNTVLVVDDNDQNLYLIEVLLKSQNFHVTTAKDGKQALEKARKDIPFMIISDILMPVMDGFTLCRAWKQDDLLKEVPFVFYTATYTDQKDEEYALSLGADKFIRKPMEPDLFLEQIQTVLKESLEKSLPTHEPLVKDEDEDYKLYSERLVNKLEKKMFQLEEEIETRKKVEIELRDSKKEWKDIFQAIGNPAFIIDNEYNILNANLAAINASKVSENELKKIPNREYTTGSLSSPADETSVYDKQDELCTDYEMAGNILEIDRSQKRCAFQAKNKIQIGEELEILTFSDSVKTIKIDHLLNMSNVVLTVAQPNNIFWLPWQEGMEVQNVARMKKTNDNRIR